MTSTRCFAVPAAGKAAIVVLLAVSLLPALAIALHAALERPADSEVQYLVALLAALPGVLLPLAMRRRSVLIDGQQLVVRAAFYTRRLPLADLDLDAARVVDLDEHPDLRPTLRTNGFSLPGYHAGHYRIGLSQRAFCLLTDRRRVLRLPERDGRLLLLSLERPQALLEALRRDVPERSRGERQPIR
jgi:hypothetical protein